MKLKVFTFILLLLFFNSVQAMSSPTVSDNVSTACSIKNVSEEVQNYLCRAFDIIHKNSLYRDQTNWAKFYKEVYKKAKGTKNLNEANAVIRYALKALGDRHGYLEIKKSAALTSAVEVQNNLPTSKVILDKLVYLNVTPAIQSGVPAAYYAEHLQALIKNMSALNPCGWIIDLRNNQNSEMWPMLLGLVPFLDSGTLGMFVYPNGNKQVWSYRNNKVMLDERVTLEIPYQRIALSSSQPNIVVLTGRKTSGAAEAVVIALKGLPNVKTFGAQTGGLSTLTAPYPLSDTVTLYLAVADYADRTGKVYGNQITPEEFVVTDGDGNDFSLLRASRWLLNQPTCMSS